jgi:agmatine deiminase
MSQIEFFVYPTDDVWTRDNGPVFVFDKDGNLIVEDWIFNGWVSLQLLSSLKGGF